MSQMTLKLQISAQSVATLLQSGLFPNGSQQVDTAHFDTDERALASAGIALMTTERDGKYVQTTRHHTEDATRQREWDKLVQGHVPVLDDVTPVRAVLGDDLAALVPAFHVVTQRADALHHRDGAQIELTLESGWVAWADRRTEIHECELRLLTGPPDALAAMARQIAALVPVRIGVLSQAERGYMLTARPRTVFKAGRVALRGDDTAAQAFQNIAASCLRHFRLNEDRLLQTRDAEALHQTRVALRRLRSAFSIAKGMLGDTGAPHFRDELRWLAQELGPARDLDVILHRAARHPLARDLGAARERAHDRASVALQSDRARGLMLDLVLWLQSGEWLHDDAYHDQRDRPAVDLAADALSKYRGKLKRDGHRIEHLTDTARHEVRKDAKKLRYATDFFRSLFGANKPRKTFVKALKHLQEGLGALNDIATAPAMLTRVGLDDQPAAADLVPHGRTRPLLRDAGRAYEDLIAAPRFWKA